MKPPISHILGGIVMSPLLFIAGLIWLLNKAIEPLMNWINDFEAIRKRESFLCRKLTKEERRAYLHGES